MDTFFRYAPQQFNDENNKTSQENEELNPMNDVHMSTLVGLDIDGDNQTPSRPLELEQHVLELHQKRKSME
ncbi:hypothetical protein Goshw_029260, partial [Gossypium schwendimanii]|nr:hypothetical protein [Gossypium schwendimanii]